MNQVIHIQVVPRSKNNSVEKFGDGFKVRITAPPVEGKANKALIEVWNQVKKFDRLCGLMINNSAAKLPSNPAGLKNSCPLHRAKNLYFLKRGALEPGLQALL